MKKGVKSILPVFLSSKITFGEADLVDSGRAVLYIGPQIINHGGMGNLICGLSDLSNGTVTRDL